jgi:hypothetical protein
VTYSPDFAQWKWGVLPGHGIDSILWVLVRHQRLAVGRFDPDCVGAGPRGLTHDNGQRDGRWERRERFPIDIFGQDGFENLLPELVRLDFALLSTLYGAGFLRHTNLLRAENVKQTPPILNVPELRIVLGAGLARDWPR